MLFGSIPKEVFITNLYGEGYSTDRSVFIQAIEKKDFTTLEKLVQKYKMHLQEKDTEKCMKTAIEQADEKIVSFLHEKCGFKIPFDHTMNIKDKKILFYLISKNVWLDNFDYMFDVSDLENPELFKYTLNANFIKNIMDNSNNYQVKSYINEVIMCKESIEYKPKKWSPVEDIIMRSVEEFPEYFIKEKSRGKFISQLLVAGYNLRESLLVQAVKRGELRIANHLMKAYNEQRRDIKKEALEQAILLKNFEMADLLIREGKYNLNKIKIELVDKKQAFYFISKRVWKPEIDKIINIQSLKDPEVRFFLSEKKNLEFFIKNTKDPALKTILGEIYNEVKKNKQKNILENVM